VTNDPTIIGVGIDLEQDTGLSPELEPLICTAEERAWLACQDQDTRPWLAKVFFSAKEAFYKCQYGTTHTVLDFLDVELNIDPCSCSFSLRRMTRADAHWGRLSSTAGKFQRVAGLIVTAAILTGEPA
jgi:4'-phosphopantetheinyl transferase EntD